MEKRVVAHFTRKPEVCQPGRLIAHLMQDLSLVPDPTGSNRDRLVATLDKMEQKGVITLDKAGNVYNAVSYHPPVATMTHAMPAEKQVQATSQTVPGEHMNVTKMSRPERMTAALKILQRIADENGEIPGRSLLEILGAELGLPRNPVYDITRHLKALGLRYTTGSRNNPVHHIDMTTTVVTAEMLDALTATDLTEEGDEPPVSTTTEETVISEATHDGEEATQPSLDIDEPPTADWQQQVVELIEDLKRQLAQKESDLRTAEDLLDDQEKAHTAELAVATKAVQDLTEALASVGQERDRLRNQLRAQQQPTSQLAALLEAHRKPAEDAS